MQLDASIHTYMHTYTTTTHQWIRPKIYRESELLAKHLAIDRGTKVKYRQKVEKCKEEDRQRQRKTYNTGKHQERLQHNNDLFLFLFFFMPRCLPSPWVFSYIG